MKEQVISMEKPSFWQTIFLQSKVNGAPYRGELLTGQNWSWPKNTYLQRRLRYLRSCGLSVPVARTQEECRS
jgi:hypothetical protein